jgi:hypothetical protein
MTLLCLWRGQLLLQQLALLSQTALGSAAALSGPPGSAAVLCAAPCGPHALVTAFVEGGGCDSHL